MPVGAVPDLAALMDEAHRVLDRAAHHPPWRPLVYRRYRLPCRRCGTNLQREMIGADEARERGVYFCPRCQSSG
ncbi:hypothetical protein SKPI104516_15935 [Skermania piniformis]